MDQLSSNSYGFDRNHFFFFHSELFKIKTKILSKVIVSKTIIFAASSYETAQKLQTDKLLMLAYSTMVYCGNIHNKENFEKTIAGYKLFKNKKLRIFIKKISIKKWPFQLKKFLFKSNFN